MTDNAMQKLAEEAKAVVAQGEHVRDSLRDLTLAALHRGKLEAEEIRKVVYSVMEGATRGLDKTGARSRQAMSEAMAGVDEALAKSAEASRLAIEEAAGRLKEFSRHDLERTFNDMRTLEQMFLDTVKQVADKSKGEANEILQGLLQHARNSGTAAGKTAADAIVALEKKLGKSLHEVAAAGRDAALGTGTRLAEAAASLLAGMADALDAKAKSLRKEK